MPSRSSNCQPETSRLSSAISASVTRGESRRQATHRSPVSAPIERTLLRAHPLLGAQRPLRRPSKSFVASRFLPARQLCSPDAVFGDLDALDALKAEEQFDEVRRRLGGDPLDDRAERLLHVLAEGDALDREAAEVHLYAPGRLKHAHASAGSPGQREEPDTPERRGKFSLIGTLLLDSR